jgi:hypothetical protein
MKRTAGIFLISSILMVLLCLVSNSLCSTGSSLTISEMSSIVGGESCSICQAGWQSTNGNITGAQGECQHGPDNDKVDCGYDPKHPEKFNGNAKCKELNGGTGDCECFACSPSFSTTCEGEVRVWLAYCGMDPTSTTQCADEICARGTDPWAAQDTVREERPSEVVGGGGCSGANGTMGTNSLCGVPDTEGRLHVFACVANNCEGQGNWSSAQVGDREICKN